MILVDTSVWIAYWQESSSVKNLQENLIAKRILGHEWVFGEIMVGNLGPQRNRLLADYLKLPRSELYPISQLYDFVEKHNLKGSGASLIDIQLLYSCVVEAHVLWTLDRVLNRLAKRFSLNFYD